MPRTQFYAASYVVLYKPEDDAVFLMQRQNTGFADGKWALPSGHVDAGEGPLACAVRECAEETGVVVKPEDLRFFHLAHSPYNTTGNGGAEAFNFFYLATTWQGVPANLEPDKCRAIGWFPLTALPTPLTGYIQTALAHLHRTHPQTVSHVNPPDTGWI